MEMSVNTKMENKTMATDKTIPISCRISVENADKLRVLLDSKGITFRNLIENLIDGVNTFETGVNTKANGKSVNTSIKKEQTLVNTGVNTISESVNTDKFMKLSEELRMPYDVMFSEIKRLTDSGELLKEGMQFGVHEQGLKVEEYLKVCKDIGKDAQKCLDGFTDSLMKGNRTT